MSLRQSKCPPAGHPSHRTNSESSPKSPQTRHVTLGSGSPHRLRGGSVTTRGSRRRSTAAASVWAIRAAASATSASGSDLISDSIFGSGDGAFSDGAFSDGAFSDGAFSSAFAAHASASSPSAAFLAAFSFAAAAAPGLRSPPRMRSTIGEPMTDVSRFTFQRQQSSTGPHGLPPPRADISLSKCAGRSSNFTAAFFRPAQALAAGDTNCGSDSAPRISRSRRSSGFSRYSSCHAARNPSAECAG